MQLVSELSLPYLPVNDPDFWKDPMPKVEEARTQHPWMAKVDQGYFVHGYQAIKDLSLMDDKLRPSFDGVVEFYGAEGTPWARYMLEMILAVSGPKHKRIRDSVASAFTPREVNRFRGLMRDRMSNLLDEWVPKGKFDFAEFASNFPISVLCGMLGTSTDAIPIVRHALETQSVVFSLNRDLLPELLAGYDVMWKFVDDLIVRREKSGPSGEGTLLDSLITTKNSGQIDDDELRFLLMVLFPAGYDTSKNMLTLTMWKMLELPEQWARCAVDHEFCAKVVEESFRHTSTATVFRTAAEDFVYGDVKFPTGTMLFFGNSLAGRDPQAFDNAKEFEPERVNINRHVAFGRGAHMCIGQHLARAQIAEGLQMIAQRITQPRLAGPIEWRAFLGTWGLRTLPIEFVPGTIRQIA